jgi:voltage-gated potassium channel
MARFYSPSPNENSKWKIKVFDVIFGHDTSFGKWFDIILILIILLSVFIALFDSMGTSYQSESGILLRIEWLFTILFTIEYIVRLMVVKHPFRFARSFYGTIDLLALLPMYLSLFLLGAQYLTVLRVLRILRIFEILHLRRYTKESSILLDSLLNSWRKIFVFLLAMLTIITVFGAIIFLVEGPENGFTNIPISMYWALVSVTTVGFGDITPVTPLGQVVASVLILLGYGIIAVPTGIYTAELASSLRKNYDDRICSSCGYSSHESKAKYCIKCGSELAEKS